MIRSVRDVMPVRDAVKELSAMVIALRSSPGSGMETLQTVWPSDRTTLAVEGST
jgi:hypothetical protein